MILPDLLKANLNLVICGTAAGNRSAERKAYYAGSGNKFYRVLFSCGFLPLMLNSEEYPILLKYGIGLTDICKTAYGMDKQIAMSDYDIKGFIGKVLKYKPKIICFNGKESARVFYRKKSTNEVSYGIQKDYIGGSIVFVAPSTSSAANSSWDVNYWKEVKALIEKMK
jgi:double-stranded uracil-DNA glycosylase